MTLCEADITQNPKKQKANTRITYTLVRQKIVEDRKTRIQYTKFQPSVLEGNNENI